jgi:protein-tyrosine-phosphatase/predicted ATP-grasp superfamily ATP-dependent carboligase
MNATDRSPTRKVLVLGRDTRAFLSVVRSLGRQGLDVHVGWCDPRAAAARSRYVDRIHELPPPSLRDFAWRDRVLAILAREDFDLVIPCNDSAILPLQHCRHDFAPFGDAIYLLDDRAYRIAFDKLESYDLARSLGIAVPRRIRVSTLDDLPAAVGSFSFPVLVKPRASFTADRLGSKHHVRWARSPRELESLVEALLPWGGVGVEETVRGHGAGVEVLAHQGEVLVAFQHVRLHEPPGGGGSSYRCSTELHPELLKATQKFLEALRYTGVAMMEFKIDPERKTWAFIEINARFWGSLPLALAAGVDFPYDLYQMWVEGRRDFPREYRKGVYCRNLVNDLLWTTRTRRTDGLIRLVTLREHLDTLVRDDPWPAVVELGYAVHRLARFVGQKAASVVAASRPLRRRRREKARQALRRATQVLFVCKGNICRSPFAHRLAEQLVPRSVRVTSGGYHPEAGRRCPDEAIHAARQIGIDLAPHRSQVVCAEMLLDADVVFVFDGENRRALRERFPWVMPRVHLLGVLGDHATTIIRDPYGRGPDDFRLAYDAIRHSLLSALASIDGRVHTP